eukprot:Anaeramoba_ignava/a123869_33.p1 GENE.a123869_33~~a123869_33.p1  ORF type:complete len:110 (+),score=11.70 a123869_33:211-540(+)
MQSLKRICLSLAMTTMLAGSLWASNTGVVRGSYINVRKEGKFNSSTVGKKLRGDTYTILFEENNWVKVQFEDGLIGWIYKTLVERRGDKLEQEKKKKEEKSIKKSEKIR